LEQSFLNEDHMHVRNSYNLPAAIWLEYSVTNRADVDLLCGMSTSLLPGITISGTGPLGHELLWTDFARMHANSASLNFPNTVRPGETFSQSILLTRVVDMSLCGRYLFDVSVSADTFSGHHVSSSRQTIAIDVVEDSTRN